MRINLEKGARRITMKNKKAITFGILLSVIAVGGTKLADRYDRYRLSRYQACAQQKAEIIEKHNIYKTVKAGEEKYWHEYWEQKSETSQITNNEKTTKEEKTSGLLGGYFVSDLPPAELVVFDKNNDHPCVWLKSHSRFINRRTASSATRVSARKTKL